METTEIRTFGGGKNFNYNDHRFYWGHYLNLALHNAHIILQTLAELDASLPRFEEESKMADAIKKLYDARMLQGKPELERSIRRFLVQHFPYLRTYEQENALKVLCDDLESKLNFLSKARNACTHYECEALEVPSETVRVAVNELYANAKRALVYNHKLYADKWYGSTEAERVACIAHLDLDKYALFAADNTFTGVGLLYFCALFLEKADAYQFLGGVSGFKNTTEAYQLATRDVFTHFCCRLPNPKLESSDIKLDMLNELTRAPRVLWATFDETSKQAFRAAYRILDDSEIEEEEDGDTKNIADAIYQRSKGKKRFSSLITKDSFQSRLKAQTNDRFAYFALRYLDDSEAFENLRFQVQLGRVRTTPYKKTLHSAEQDRPFIKPVRVFGRLSDYLNKAQDEIFTTPKNPNLPNPNDYIEQFAPKYLLENNRILLRFAPSNKKDKKELNDRLGNWIAHTSAKTKDGNNPKPTTDEKFWGEKADAVLSANELPNLVFYHHLQQKGWIAETAENLMQRYHDQFRKFCNDIKTSAIMPLVAPPDLHKFTPPKPPARPKNAQDKINAENARKQRIAAEKELVERTKTFQNYFNTNGFDLLCITEMPDAIREYVLGYKPTDRVYAAKNTIKNLRKANKALLNTLGKNEGKEKHKRDPKPGKIGEWLANDIKFLKPYIDKKDANGNIINDNKGRPTDIEFVKLHADLALFDTQKHLIWAYFEELGLVGNDALAPHPFLKNCKNNFEQHDIYSFYKNYLYARGRWLTEFEDLFFAKKKGDLDTFTEAFFTENAYWLNLNTKTVVDIEAILGLDYSTMPINLPRSLFNAPIIKALQTNGFPNIPLTRKNKKRVVIGTSINFAMERYLRCDRQDFYNLPQYWFQKDNEDERKAYAISEEKQYLEEEISELKKMKPLSQDETRLLKQYKRTLDDIAEQDKVIRHALHTDRLLLLMIKHLFEQQTTVELQNTLNSFTLKTLKTFLQRKNVYPIELHLDGKTITTKTSIHLYGEFRRFMKDKRLPAATYINDAGAEDLIGLFHWYDMDKIDYDRLKTEIKYYNENRHKVLEKIFEFERHFIKKDKLAMENGQPQQIIRSAATYTDHLIFLRYLKTQGVIDENKLQELRQLRGKFSHNQIPFFSNIGITKITPETLYTAPLITQQLIEYAVAQYGLLMLPAE